jgi:hypothetical protein
VLWARRLAQCRLRLLSSRHRRAALARHRPARQGLAAFAGQGLTDTTQQRLTVLTRQRLTHTTRQRLTVLTGQRLTHTTRQRLTALTGLARSTGDASIRLLARLAGHRLPGGHRSGRHRARSPAAASARSGLRGPYPPGVDPPGYVAGTRDHPRRAVRHGTRPSRHRRGPDALSPRHDRRHDARGPASGLAPSGAEAAGLMGTVRTGGGRDVTAAETALTRHAVRRCASAALSRPAVSRTAHSGTAHSGAAHSGAAHFGAADSGAGQSGAAHSGGARTGTTLARTALSGAARTGPTLARGALNRRAVACGPTAATADSAPLLPGVRVPARPAIATGRRRCARASARIAAGRRVSMRAGPTRVGSAPPTEVGPTVAEAARLIGSAGVASRPAAALSRGTGANTPRTVTEPSTPARLAVGHTVPSGRVAAVRTVPARRLPHAGRPVPAGR